jgi:hypothetical protein
MLSAILSRIQGIRNEPKSKRRHDMMNICVLAYPDLRPWQVRQACLGENFTSSHSTTSDLEFHKMYYEYLSLLLHPWEGHDAARQDAELVTVCIDINLIACFLCMLYEIVLTPRIILFLGMVPTLTGGSFDGQ